MFKVIRQLFFSVGLLILCLTSVAQSSSWTFSKTDSTTFRGLGVGFEYYSGHEKFSKIFKFKRNPIDEYKIGKGIYITYFNLNENKNFHYYIDGGFIFWNKKKVDLVSTLDQHSEILQFTARYTIGSFGILGRIGGLFNHNTTTQENSLTVIKNNSTDLTIGAGLSIPIPFPRTNGLNFTILINKIDNYYYWSGTIFLPLLFH